MTKKGYDLYNALGKIEERLLSIRSRLMRDEIGTELAAIKARSVSVELAEIAVSVFREYPQEK
jgi:hypothetical protein